MSLPPPNQLASMFRMDPHTYLQRGVSMVRAERNLEWCMTQQIDISHWWSSNTNTKEEAVEEPSSRDRLLVYQRFVDAIKLVVEEDYAMNGNVVGFYSEVARGLQGEGLLFMLSLLDQAHCLKLLPPWWNPQRHEIEMTAIAMSSRHFNIQLATVLEDVQKVWGYTTTQVLRTLGQTIYQSMEHQAIPSNQGHTIPLPYRSRTDPTFQQFIQTTQQQSYIECSTCHTNRPVQGFYSKNQLRKPRGQQKCSFCTGTYHVSIGIQASCSNSPMGNNQDNHCGEPNYTGMSNKHFLDYITELSGGLEPFLQLCDIYSHAVSPCDDYATSSLHYVLSNKHHTQDQARQCLRDLALQDHNSMALYLLAKQHKDDNPKRAALYCSKAALQGNALAMAGLALMHRDAGCTSTAIHWWERVLQSVAMPEAAYNIGVMYGKENADNVICFRQAAHYYCHCQCMDTLRYQDPMIHGMEDHDRIGIHSWMANDIGPNNDNQSEYIPLAKKNLEIVESYLGNYREHPVGVHDHKELPPYVDAVDDDNASTTNSNKCCAMCGKRPRVGNLPLQQCSACHSILYCNSICQLGHWHVHKHKCSKKS